MGLQGRHRVPIETSKHLFFFICNKFCICSLEQEYKTIMILKREYKRVTRLQPCVFPLTIHAS